MKKIEEKVFEKIEKYLQNLSSPGHSYPITIDQVQQFYPEEINQYKIFDKERYLWLKDVSINNVEAFLVEKNYVNVEFFSGVKSYYLLFLIPGQGPLVFDIGYATHSYEQKLEILLNGGPIPAPYVRTETDVD